MPLERIRPVVRQFDLGALRITQDELADVVRLVRELPDVDVRIESENNELTDIREDLPQLGPRVSYISIAASRTSAENNALPEVLAVRLNATRAVISTTDPNPTTLGLVELIKSAVADCRRMPVWLWKIFRRTADPQGQLQPPAIPLFLAVAALILGVLGSLGVSGNVTNGNGGPLIAWSLSLVFVILSGALIVALIFGFALSRTIILTATRAAAPTFWQRHRADIAINLIVGLLLFLLGLLVGSQ
jgi:cytochrome c oxidase subunit IV